MPKLFFVYSWLYDKALASSRDRTVSTTQGLYGRGTRRAETLKKEWDNKGKKVFGTIQSVTSLPWHRGELYCYLVRELPSGIPTLLDPLTVPLDIGPEEAIGIITHELVHQNLEQNGLLPWVLEKTTVVGRMYEDEADSVKLHIPICAVLDRVYPMAFGKSTAERFRKEVYPGSSMRRAWEIVTSYGPDSVIEEIKRTYKAKWSSAPGHAHATLHPIGAVN